MKKYTIFYMLFCLASNQALAQSTCQELFERLPVLISKENFSSLYRETLEKTNLVRNNSDFAAIFSQNQKPGWTAYNSVSILLKMLESPLYLKLPNIEKLALKKEFSQNNAILEKQLDESLKSPEFLEKYKKHIDENYAFFALLEKINEKSEVSLFPRSRLDLTVSNRETILQAEKILTDLNKDYAKDFSEHSGYKSLEEYTKFVKNFDHTSNQIVDLMQDHVLVAMHRPESARFWIPLTGFQNQRVTGSSKGALSTGRRNQAESNLLLVNQLEYEKNSVRLMPKYAEVIVGREVTDIKNGSDASHYGSDLWIIKKSVIEKRATWTPTDSLGPGRSVANNKVDGFIPWSFRSLATPFLYYNIKSEKLFQPRGSFAPIKFNSTKWESSNYYTEVQIFGDVSINDVEALHFRGSPPDQKMMEYLNSKNIEVYDDRTGKPVKYTGEL